MGRVRDGTARPMLWDPFEGSLDPKLLHRTAKMGAAALGRHDRERTLARWTGDGVSPITPWHLVLLGSVTLALLLVVEHGATPPSTWTGDAPELALLGLTVLLAAAGIAAWRGVMWSRAPVASLARMPDEDRSTAVEAGARRTARRRWGLTVGGWLALQAAAWIALHALVAAPGALAHLYTATPLLPVPAVFLAAYLASERPEAIHASRRGPTRLWRVVDEEDAARSRRWTYRHPVPDERMRRLEAVLPEAAIAPSSGRAGADDAIPEASEFWGTLSDRRPFWLMWRPEHHDTAMGVRFHRAALVLPHRPGWDGDRATGRPGAHDGPTVHTRTLGHLALATGLVPLTDLTVGRGRDEVVGTIIEAFIARAVRAADLASDGEEAAHGR